MLPIWRAARICGRRSSSVHARFPHAVSTTHCRLFSSASCTSSDITVRTQEEMEAVGARVAANRRAGDVIFLRGDLGCGKTCFARGFIREMTRDPRLQVTSPTYLLVNTYENTAEDALPDQSFPIIHHVDLYRLDAVSDVDATALGLTEAFATGISLVEWPQRLLDGSVPSERLEVEIHYDDQDATMRHLQFTPFGTRWQEFKL